MEVTSQKGTFGEDWCFLLLPSRAALSAAKQERSTVFFIGVTNEFEVLTNYILSLYTVSVRKSYDVSELGLSGSIARGLVMGTADVQILSRLLKHRNFPKLIDLIQIYFQDTSAKG